MTRTGISVFIVANVNPARSTASGVRAHTMELKAALESRGQTATLVGKGRRQDPDFLSVSRHDVGDLRFTLALFRLKLPRHAVVHAQYPLYALPFTLRGYSRVVAVLHGDNVRAIASKRGHAIAWMYGLCERLALRTCATVVAGSEEVAREYERRWPETAGRIEVIRLFPDERLFRPAPRGTHLRNEGHPHAPSVLFVGRLRRDKRPDLVLRAYARLRESMPSARLRVVGDGSERPSLEALTRNLSVEDGVEFLGSVPRERVAEVLRTSAVLAVASSYEAGPFVVAEARLCGIPVVATDVGRVREFRSRYGGVEIVAGDPEPFADALRRSILAGPVLPPEISRNSDSMEQFVRVYGELVSRD